MPKLKPEDDSDPAKPEGDEQIAGASRAHAERPPDEHTNTDQGEADHRPCREDEELRFWQHGPSS